ncbi:MAG: DEAD/DEAH box helicase, partial [Dehalococcoidia bacterium]
VIGGLDSYLRRYLQENPLPSNHRLPEIVRLLPPQGYAALHPVQRRRVVEELLAALAEPVASPSRAKAAPAVATKAAVAAAPRRGTARFGGGMDSPVAAFKGISKLSAARLARLGVRRAGDLLTLFPYRYNDFANVRPISELAVGEEQTVVASVWAASATTIGRRKGSEAIVGDDTGTLRVIWWGQTHIGRQLRSGAKLALSGRVSVYRGRRQMESPEWELLDSEGLPDVQAGIHTGRLVPVYPGTEGLSQRLVRRIVKEAVDALARRVSDPLPDHLRQRLNLLPASEALRQIHFPDSWEAAEAARHRFAFEELLYIQLGVLKRRQQWQAQGQAPSLSLPREALDGFIASLTFEPTGAQRRAVEEILADLARNQPMSRLLQGDVGSGKTVVATAALLAAVAGGFQGAIMAPTEILAEQHYRTLSSLLSGGQEGLWTAAFAPPYLDRPVRVVLLTGSLASREKEGAQDAIARGETDIAVGTQALIQ